MAMAGAWHELPPITLPTPITALALNAAGDALWAAGVGGVASRAAASAWQPRVADLHLSAVTALGWASGWLLAGGPEGIACSSNGGRSWRLATIAGGGAHVVAFALSPTFADDGVALAATLGDGVLRTSDGGRTWEPVTFGLAVLEVTAVVWLGGERALAGTVDGIYRSPNGGRAWRAVPGTEGAAVAALAALPNGEAMAALETGGVLHSSDGGASWELMSGLPDELAATTLLTTSQGTLLLGSTNHGLLRSTEGVAWAQVAADAPLALVAGPDALYAGTLNGLLHSLDDGASWQPLAPPPLHDLRRLLVVADAPVAWGVYGGALRYTAGSWQPLQLPTPLAALDVAPDGALLAAGPHGIARSADAGASWHSVAATPLGLAAQLSLSAAGWGAAGAGDSTQLLVTNDGGRSWQRGEWPFGGLLLRTLQATDQGLLAATYDPRQRLAQPWRSRDHGASWERGATTPTAWPLASSYHRPPLLALGNLVHWERTDGDWSAQQIGPEGGAVRRVVGDGRVLLALATSGVYRSDDQAASWQPWPPAGELPAEQLMDVALADDAVWVLLSGGRVLRYPWP
jgi:photosystem II stability/assembly factor-like uncharacterized protein